MDTNTLNIEVKKTVEEPKLNDLEAIGTVSILDLIVTRIRLLAIRRVAWLRKLWQDSGQDGEQGVNFHRIVDNILHHVDNRDAEIAWRFEQPELEKVNREINEIEYVLEEDTQSYFFQIRQQLNLNQAESNLLQLLIAVAHAPELSKVYAYLQDDSGRGYVTDALVSRLFDGDGADFFSAASPLYLWNVVRKRNPGNGEAMFYECDSHIISRLQGQNALDEKLLGIAYLQMAKPALPGWPLEQILTIISQTLEVNTWQPLRIILAGFAGSGRKTFAATLCDYLKLPLLSVDKNRIEKDRWEELYTHVQRHAFLEVSAIAWTGTDWEKTHWPKMLTPFRIQFILCEPDDHISAVEGVIDHRFEMPAFSIKQRRQVWKQQLPISAEWSEEAFEALVSRHQVTIGQVSDVVRRDMTSPAEIAKMLGASSKHHLGKLAQHLPCPFEWEDLILSDWLKAYLSDFIFEAGEREAVWENESTRRLFPQGKGLMALFSGPPGTGKTMAAQVLAAKLGMELYRIDLSAIVSKYVGETSKNLERILSKAKQINAVLLFDEADSLFGKRTDIKDAHDRYANTDTNYLLQAIESYSGIAILATNKKSNIDSGFIRRLRYVLEFAKPDKISRFRLWQRIIGELTAAAVFQRMEADIKQIARLADLSGAQIKFAVLTAVFLSRRDGVEMNIKHLLSGLERELIKEGRGLNPELLNIKNRVI